MDLFDNPFYILNATSRDNRQRITELAEERSLLLDSDKCMQARSDLTNPRKRLTAEVAWLPGVGQKQVEKILTYAGGVVSSDSIGMNKLMPLARANSLAAVLSRLPGSTSNDIDKWILEIARAFEAIDPQELRAVINEERMVSGFREVTDLSAVEEEIQKQRRHYCQAINSALDKLSAEECTEALTVAVESATGNGENHGPVLIDDLVDSYGLEVKDALEEEERNIKRLAEKLRAVADAKRPDSILSPMVNELIQAVEDWDFVAQPIQVSAKSRGLPHAVSNHVAHIVRELAVHLWNEHRKLDFSRQLTHMLKEVFAEDVELGVRLNEDEEVLDNLADQQVRANEPVEDDATENVRATNERSGNKFNQFVAVAALIIVIVYANNGFQSTRQTATQEYDATNNAGNVYGGESTIDGNSRDPGRPSQSPNFSQSAPEAFSTSSDTTQNPSFKSLPNGHDTQSRLDHDTSSDATIVMPSPPDTTLEYFPADEATDTSQNARVQNVQYEKPPAGTNNRLSVSQMRWCKRESIRINVVENMAEDGFATQKSNDEFQKIVGDYKDRCHNKRRSENDLWRQAFNEVVSIRDQIESEARSDWMARH